MLSASRIALKGVVVLFAVIGVFASVQQLRAQNAAPLANPTIVHVGIVVRDLDKAMQYFKDAFGIDMPKTGEYGPMTIPGDVPGKAESRIRNVVFTIGTLGIELIEPVRGPGPHPEFLNKYGPGLQHIGMVVRDQQTAIKYLEGKGGKRTLRTYVDMKEQMGFTFEVMDNR